jgi:hypothetical protein
LLLVSSIPHVRVLEMRGVPYEISGTNETRTDPSCRTSPGTLCVLLVRTVSNASLSYILVLDLLRCASSLGAGSICTQQGRTSIDETRERGPKSTSLDKITDDGGVPIMQHTTRLHVHQYQQAQYLCLLPHGTRMLHYLQLERCERRHSHGQ